MLFCTLNHGYHFMYKSSSFRSIKQKYESENTLDIFLAPYILRNFEK